MQTKEQEKAKVKIIERGKLEEVRTLLKHELRPDERFKYFGNCTPLHCAINNKDVRVLRCLLDECVRLKIDIDIIDDEEALLY